MPRDTDSIKQEDIAQETAVAVPAEHRSFWSMFGTYWKALFMPTSRTFAEEKRYATWKSVWAQLFFLVICLTVVNAIIFIQKFFYPYNKVALQNNFFDSIVSLANASTSFPAMLIYLIYVPLSFFLFMIFQFLFAKGFRGVGRFVEQCYTVLLFYVPFLIISNILGAFLTITPLAGQTFLTITLRGTISMIFLILSIIINVPALMGVHRLTRGQAILIMAAQVVFAIIIVVVFVFLGGNFLDKYLRSLN